VTPREEEIMFVQVIKGNTTDPDGLRQQLERWRADLRPGAAGFLGSTGGVADDGTVVLVARFADTASARANSDRPEQGEWWARTATFFAGEPSFRESTDTTELFDGGSDDAGFVQVMEGRVADREKAEAFESPEMLDQLRAARPDLIGGLRTWFDDGTFVDVAYFTSEEAARQGESSEEFQGPSDDYNALFEEMTFIDLRDPMFI
jgi:hypothetical protein